MGKALKVVMQVAFLYGFVLLGNGIKQWLHLPLSGSIIGLLLLWATLSFKLIHIQWVEAGSLFLLSYLPLYFIPATVGIIDYGYVFKGKGVLLIVIVVVSTLLTMWASGYTSHRITNRLRQPKKGTTSP